MLALDSVLMECYVDNAVLNFVKIVLIRNVLSVEPVYILRTVPAYSNVHLVSIQMS